MAQKATEPLGKHIARQPTHIGQLAVQRYNEPSVVGSNPTMDYSESLSRLRNENALMLDPGEGIKSGLGRKPKSVHVAVVQQRVCSPLRIETSGVARSLRSDWPNRSGVADTAGMSWKRR